MKETLSDNFLYLFGDILIGALPIFVKFCVLVLKNSTIQLKNDFLLLSILVVVTTYLRIMAPITANKHCNIIRKSEERYYIITICFIYFFVFTLLLYLSDSIGINITKWFFPCLFANFLFSIVCNACFNHKCSYPTELECRNQNLTQGGTDDNS